MRMPPHLHERLASRAKDDKASLNALIVEILQKALTDHVSDEEAGKPVLARLR
jgi:predicted HicB family RNase H-like nuclease